MPNFRHEADARCFNKIGGSSSGGAHLGVAASNLCSTESMSEAECLSAAQALLPAGQRQGRQHLVAGNWNHVPPGCSLQSTGDWAAHYNRRASGSNSGGYTPVCSGGGGTAPFHFPQIQIELPPLSRTQASQLPQTWDASDVRFDIETVVEPPAVVTSVIVSSDWWMKRPKDLQIFLVDSNSIATPVATVEYPTSMDICGMNGDEQCSYPTTPTSMLTIDVDSDIVASTVRVAVLTPRNEPGTGNDQVMIKEVAVVTVGGGVLAGYEPGNVGACRTANGGGGSGMYSRADHVDNVAQCASACDASSTCFAFEFTGVTSGATGCELHRQPMPAATGHSNGMCYNKPAVMVDGCPNQNREVPRAAVSPDSAATASVRCCSHSSATTCVTNLPGGCQNGKTFLEAFEICELNGQRLCTEDEMSVDRLCCGTGCGFDGHQIWVGR